MPLIYGGGGSSGIFATDVVTTARFIAADGTSSLPSFTWTSALSSGLYNAGSGFIGLTGANGVDIAIGTTSKLRTTGTQSQLQSTQSIGWSSGNLDGTASDVAISRAGANSLVFGGAITGATTTARTEINKAITAFTNATLKATFTVTVPNAAHNATIEFRVMGALGAGGAIGAGEAMATNTYVIGIVRTAGVATVATATAAFGAVAVAVAGAATVTATMAVSAMTGLVSATQTFTLDVTISRSGGSSDNHTAMCYAKLLNANATGITIS